MTAIAPPALPPTPPPSSGRSRQIWRAPRRPAVIAAVVIAAFTAAMWGLRWWGPVNPELSVSWDQYDTSGGTARLVVTNHSHSWVTVESATLARFENRSTTSLAEPVAVAPSSSATVDVALPDCRNIGSPRGSSVDATVTARTAVGGTTEAVGIIGSVDCGSRLPPPGEQPADPEAARREVTEAFWTVYDHERPTTERLAAIADPRDIEALGSMAASGPPGALMATSKAGVTEIVFDRPDHAWVEYDVVSTSGSSPGNPQWLTIGGIGPGEAELVDGVWKVARQTVCNDLARASISCPG